MAKRKSAKRGGGSKGSKHSGHRATASSNGSLSQVGTSELARELHRRRSSVGRLARRREKLIAQVAAIDAEMAGLGASPGGERRRPRNDSNLKQALAGLLTNNPLSVTEAARQVQEAGYRTTSPNFRTIVNQTLLKGPFKRVSRGVYQTK